MRDDDFFGGWDDKPKQKKKPKPKPQITITDIKIAVNPDQITAEIESVKIFYQISAGQVNVDIERPYTWKDFPEAEKIQERNLFLVHFGKTMKIKEVHEELKKRQLTFAGLEELVSVGTKTALLKDFPVAALRWVFFNEDFPYLGFVLGYYKGKRYLHLSDLEQNWHKDCRFLAVRKKNVK